MRTAWLVTFRVKDYVCDYYLLTLSNSQESFCLVTFRAESYTHRITCRLRVKPYRILCKNCGNGYSYDEGDAQHADNDIERDKQTLVPFFSLSF